MTQTPPQPPQGWYPDPAGSGGERYWDGTGWSQSTRDPQPTTAPDPAAFPADGSAGHPGYPGRPGYGAPMGAGYAPTPAGPRLAPLRGRLLGYLIDNILVIMVVGSFLSLAQLPAMADAALARWSRELAIWADNPVGAMPMPGADYWTALLYSTLATTAAYALYRTALLGTMNATLGQMAVGLRVVKKGQGADQPLGWGTAALRGILGAVLFQLIGFINGIFAAFTREKQTLHDMAAKTHVLKVR